MAAPTPTTPGTVLGTVGYMSPEQVRGQPLEARSDLFSFGAILYEMISGKRAFKGRSSVETMNAHSERRSSGVQREQPARVTGTGSDRPPLLGKEQAMRFQSPPDLAFDLESLSSGSTPTMAVSAFGWDARADCARRCWS